MVTAILSGCGTNEDQVAGERILIRVGSSTATVRDFHEAFESNIIAPSLLYSDAENLRDEKYRTLNRLTEELVILERARELELQISDMELRQAVDNFKKDFPDDTFEQTLIENGVSYLSWEKGLKRRLLMEKVIQKDISENTFQVPLTAEEAEATIETPEDDNAGTSNSTTIAPSDDAREGSDTVAPESDAGTDVASGVPDNTSESQYSVWIERLKQKYAIEIDWKLWEKIEQEDAVNA
jgi:hypothetical protein